MLDRFGEVADRPVRVTVRDAFTHAMIEMSLKNDLARLVERALGGVDLQEDVFARHVFVDHFVDRRHLTDDFLQTSMKIGGIHALAHRRNSS